jgi:hypothetical protein
MKKFVFEITLLESDLEGDEFWEEAIERDGTGIADLTEALIAAIADSNLVMEAHGDSGQELMSRIVKLKNYTNE